MWNISKTADCRAKQTCGTRGTTVHIYAVLLMPDSLSLVWGHSVHFAKLPSGLSSLKEKVTVHIKQHLK